MNNKIGMNMLLWGVDINSSHIPIFEGIKRAGFDGVEIPVIGQSGAELKLMKDALKSLELECTTATFVTADVNPIDPDAAVRAKAIASLKQRVDESAALGSDILIGGIYQAHRYFTGCAASSEEWQWSAECLHSVGEYAQTMGIRLGLEFLNRFEAFLINTSADAKRMTHDVGLSNVGILYDTHHANIEDPAPEVALTSIVDELVHVHLSESHRGTLGTGQVNWADNFKTLKELDYRGWLTVEAFSTADPAISSAANIWRNAFDSTDQLYGDAIEFIKTGMSTT